MTKIVLKGNDCKMVEFGELKTEECFLWDGHIVRKTHFLEALNEYNCVYVSEDNFVKISDDTLVTPIRQITISYEV